MSKKPVEIEGSDGLFSVNSETGEIIDFTPYGKELPTDHWYMKIEKFDIPEWEQRTSEKAEDNGIDILDMSFWNKDGKYVAQG